MSTCFQMCVCMLVIVTRMFKPLLHNVIEYIIENGAFENIMEIGAFENIMENGAFARRTEQMLRFPSYFQTFQRANAPFSIIFSNVPFSIFSNILCTISLAISYVSHLFCAHLCAVSITFNCNDENRILGK